MPKHYESNKPSEREVGYATDFLDTRINPIVKTKVRVIPLGKAEEVEIPNK